MPGRWIVRTSWITLGVFAVATAPVALGVDALDGVAVATSLTLFLASLPIWLYAFGRAIVRSAQGDEIAVASWVFLTPSAPREVRRSLLGATVAGVAVAAATAYANPFSVLVPMLPLGFAALWGARHGTYPPRRTPATAKGGRR